MFGWSVFLFELLVFVWLVVRPRAHLGVQILGAALLLLSLVALLGWPVVVIR